MNTLLAAVCWMSCPELGCSCRRQEHRVGVWRGDVLHFMWAHTQLDAVVRPYHPVTWHTAAAFMDIGHWPFWHCQAASLPRHAIDASPNVCAARTWKLWVVNRRCSHDGETRLQWSWLVNWRFSGHRSDGQFLWKVKRGRQSLYGIGCVVDVVTGLVIRLSALCLCQHTVQRQKVGCVHWMVRDPLSSVRRQLLGNVWWHGGQGCRGHVASVAWPWLPIHDHCVRWWC